MNRRPIHIITLLNEGEDYPVVAYILEVKKEKDQTKVKKGQNIKKIKICTKKSADLPEFRCLSA